MVINTNTSAQTAASNLQTTQSMLSKSLARLSSGSKITNPSDDAAGMAVSSRLDAQVSRLDAAKQNVGNAISYTQTQDGFLSKIGKALDRMSELAILSQDVTKTDSDRSLYDSEFTQLSSYINSTASKDFNGVSLFSNAALSVTTDSEGTTFSMSGIDLSTSIYATATSSTIATTSAAATALSNIKSAITQLSTDRATIGSYQARLNFTSDELVVSKENLSAASSRIKDVDVAEESTQYARYNILTQAGTAMLAQANQLPQSVLRLLQ
ncbi:MAG: flagellin [Verrucomicrobiales bacterium]|nr:flagellin [Verrucomicrobiales bacterium]MDB6129070.1 flagellin [Verrucomicrobiales bacterium]